MQGKMLNLMGKKISSLKQYNFVVDPKHIEYLDLTDNQLTSAEGILPFQNLNTLIVDKNNLSSLSSFPKINTLQTFNANQNNFSDLICFINDVKTKFPNLIHLNLLKNPMNPMFTKPEKYPQYQVRVFNALPKLLNLDGMDKKYVDFSIEIQKDSHSKSTKYSKENQNEDSSDYEDNTQDNVQKKTAEVEYDESFANKYKKKQLTSRSEGNRFVKNNML